MESKVLCKFRNDAENCLEMECSFNLFTEPLGRRLALDFDRLRDIDEPTDDELPLIEDVGDVPPPFAAIDAANAASSLIIMSAISSKTAFVDVPNSVFISVFMLSLFFSVKFSIS